MHMLKLHVVADLRAVRDEAREMRRSLNPSAAGLFWFGYGALLLAIGAFAGSLT